MQNNIFSPSVNIIRDSNRDLNYIPTRNGESAFNKITSAFESGTKSFNLVGAYGSGKSAFILALEKVLNNKADFFFNPIKGEVSTFEKCFIIGEYKSFKSAFCENFGIKKKEECFKEFGKELKRYSKEKTGLLIVVDEFGKFLEFAAKESPEEELYFIQQLSEVVNDPEFPVLFITTLHQAFEDYALELNKTQKNEWDKVKGRLVEITFNEPVEQLLFLASERISQKDITPSFSQSLEKNLFNAINESGAFPLKDYFSPDFARKIFPFDLLSASILTLALHNYGQNERSLFSFLESEDFLGLTDFDDGKQFFHLGNVFDYLSYNFHSFLNSKFNPHGAQWRAIFDALERTEGVFEYDFKPARELIKVIGLLSIFGRAGQRITKEFLCDYGKHALQIGNAEKIVERLEKNQIIRFTNYNQRYVLFKGTDVDIDKELELAEDRISKDFSVVNQLRKYFNVPIFQAKRSFYETGTPRYFVTEISETPTSLEPEGSVDGYINLVFSNLIDSEAVKNVSAENNCAILYGYFKEYEGIREKLTELEKIEIVKKDCQNDSIALAELNNQSANAKETLNSLIIGSFYGQSSMIDWYFLGIKYSISSSKELNSLLSDICEKIYFNAPILKNELMNKEKLNGTISGARNKLVAMALNNSEMLDFGFRTDKYPPEKTIYLSLLKNTGIHDFNGKIARFKKPEKESFAQLWSVSETFLEECSIAPRKLRDFIDLLRQKPFKLKRGFVEFWVPLFLIAKQKYFAFYEEDRFVPNLSVDTLEVAMKQPQKYYVSTFHLNETETKLFNKYRYFLNQVESINPDTDTFIETIKPFLTFYKRLVPYSRQTKHVSKNSQRLRVVLENTEDPVKAFFDEIPRALGFSLNGLEQDSNMEEFTLRLKETTRELSAAYSELINRIEGTINQTIDGGQLSFPENKVLLQKRFNKVKKEQLKPKLKVLLQRINTPLDDRQSWLISIATAILNKTPDKFTDDDVEAFDSLLKEYLYELDNITDISTKDIDSNKEEVLKFEVTSFVRGVQKHLIRMPKSKNKQIVSKMGSIRNLLDKRDRQTNIALLIKLLQEEIENE
jgi:hypothetical protein